MNERLKDAKSFYDEMVRESDNLAVTVGRSASDVEKSVFIWQDIKTKLRLRPNIKLLDIGCGYGEVTRYLLEEARKLDIELTLVDIPSVIDAIKMNFKDLLPKSARLMSGFFPDDFPQLTRDAEEFDCILCYSVVHCSDDPKTIITSAADILSPGGRLLVGDLPNIDKKGRFLSTDFGRHFEADYRGVSVDQIAEYSDHRDYVARGLRKEENRTIDDGFLIGLMSDYRDKGFNAFLTDQDERLPYSFTREDLLIVKNN